MAGEFESIEEALREGGAEAAFEQLARRFIEEKKYPQLFETRLMKKRLELGLPLIQTESPADFPSEIRKAYDAAMIEAARETGGLFLAAGEIARAWPYFRAIGEAAPIAEALERVDAGPDAAPLIEIAYQERVNPRKGFEMILALHGTCRAITFFDQYPDRATREQALELLARTLYEELVSSLQHAIAQAEGETPETRSVPDLIAGREWLFGEYSYYVDTSHIHSVVRYSLDSENPTTLRMALEMADYAAHLSPMFQMRGEPPFEDPFPDQTAWLRALLGERVEEAIAHFRKKADAAEAEQSGYAPAEYLVRLLLRLDRPGEALAMFQRYLADADPAHLMCPSALQLCQLAGDYRNLAGLAREKGDLLSFAAAAIQEAAMPARPATR
jgi:hypothetical protein